MTAATLLILSDNDVRQVVRAGDLIAPIGDAFRLHAQGGILAPDESRIEVRGTGSVYGYLAWAPSRGQLGAKILSAFDQNPILGHPYIEAVTTLHDPETGRVVCVMNGGYLTAARTAAAAALATQHLADPKSETLGILGAGLQAETSCEAHLASGRIREVRIWSRRAEQVTALVERLRERSAHVRFVISASAADAARSDVVCTTTRATSPLIRAADVPPGSHLNVIGQLRPERSEVDPGVLRSWPTYTDSRQKLMAAWSAAPIPRPRELGEVILGPAPHRAPGERTIFKPMGMPFEDIVAAQLAFSRAIDQGLGHTVSW